MAGAELRGRDGERHRRLKMDFRDVEAALAFVGGAIFALLVTHADWLRECLR